MARISSTSVTIDTMTSRACDALPSLPGRNKPQASGAHGRQWVLLACLLWTAQATAAEHAPLLLSSGEAAAEEVWTISSRQVGCEQGQAPRLAYWRFDHAAHRWQVASHEAYIASDDPAVPTCVFVHGNRVARNEAFDVGWRAYQSIKAQARGTRFRFVIWSWPSTRIAGLFKDVRAKAYLSDVHSLYLAWLLDQMHPQVRVSLVGYSFGARLIAGSLHLLGGGQLAGRAMAARLHPDRLPVRAVLMAGALDSQALLPHARNGRALTQVDRMLVMTNPADKVLRYFRLLDGFGARTLALGTAGAAGYQSPARSGKVTHWNVSRFVGPVHEWSRYLLSPPIVSGMKRYALFLE